MASDPITVRISPSSGRLGEAQQKRLPRPELQPNDRFLRSLYIEQRRCERSSSRFVLMLLDLTKLLTNHEDSPVLQRVVEGLADTIRETDQIGWHRPNTVIGVIFTEIGEADGKILADALLKKICSTLAACLSIDQIRTVSLSIHVYPADWADKGGDRPGGPDVFPDSPPGAEPKRSHLAAKRVVDILGSLAAIMLFSPIMLGAAIAVKLTSKGPVLFKQRRVGQHGRTFPILKFRSMRCETDESIHKEYAVKFIAGRAEGEQPGLYKIANDPRLTPIGRFLRRSSIDELPQFFNVLMGDMSIVGPRPPVPYEVERYSPWHRRRVMSVKPGITGLWQVTGRSRVTFDEMVRLDLEYTRTWSPWLDMRIILKTPRAVLDGSGAC
jgi:lipopolysaccharide/colanic/teichoic acid biosynthesis glycosyltransferase